MENLVSIGARLLRPLRRVMFQVTGINKLDEGLYISDVMGVILPEGKKQIESLKIRRVLSVSYPIDEAKKIPQVKYKHLRIYDLQRQDLLGTGLLKRALDYIEEAEASGEPVLVHCEAGKSRSATVVTAHLMKKNQWSVEEALAHVRSSHPVAAPNASFRLQLKLFEEAGYVADPTVLFETQAYKSHAPLLAAHGIKSPLRDGEEPRPRESGWCGIG